MLLPWSTKHCLEATTAVVIQTFKPEPWSLFGHFDRKLIVSCKPLALADRPYWQTSGPPKGHCNHSDTEHFGVTSLARSLFRHFVLKPRSLFGHFNREAVVSCKPWALASRIIGEPVGHPEAIATIVIQDTRCNRASPRTEARGQTTAPSP